MHHISTRPPPSPSGFHHNILSLVRRPSACTTDLWQSLAQEHAETSLAQLTDTRLLDSHAPRHTSTQRRRRARANKPAYRTHARGHPHNDRRKGYGSPPNCAVHSTRATRPRSAPACVIDNRAVCWLSHACANSSLLHS